jgi:transcriptional regulator with XRE-family HTH domain
MNGTPQDNSAALAAKIARLVEEKGWNFEDFARFTRLNRQTVRTILKEGGRNLRNSTVMACAKALGLPVSDLRNLPLERLIARVNGLPATGDETLSQLYEQVSNPELVAWIDRNQVRAKQLNPQEIDELLAMQASGAALTSIGVERFIEFLERKRKLMAQVQVIAGTEYIEVLEKLVGLMYEKVRPYGDRK